jgi:hypothetical protein
MNAQLTGQIDIYARVSRLRDADKTTTTAQVSECRSVLGERGLPTGKVHVDDGKSAWNPDVHRPGWEALMGRLESGQAGGMIVYDMERFTRQMEEGMRLMKLAERGLLVLDSDAEFDLTTATGKKNFWEAIVAANYYSNRLRQEAGRVTGPPSLLLRGSRGTPLRRGLIGAVQGDRDAGQLPVLLGELLPQLALQPGHVVLDRLGNRLGGALARRQGLARGRGRLGRDLGRRGLRGRRLGSGL